MQAALPHAGSCTCQLYSCFKHDFLGGEAGFTRPPEVMSIRRSYREPWRSGSLQNTKFKAFIKVFMWPPPLSTHKVIRLQAVFQR